MRVQKEGGRVDHVHPYEKPVLGLTPLSAELTAEQQQSHFTTGILRAGRIYDTSVSKNHATYGGVMTSWMASAAFGDMHQPNAGYFIRMLVDTGVIEPAKKAKNLEETPIGENQMLGIAALAIAYRVKYGAQEEVAVDELARAAVEFSHGLPFASSLHIPVIHESAATKVRNPFINYSRKGKSRAA